MVKIRIEGSEGEIKDIIGRFQFNYRPGGKPILDIKNQSKFYPNKQIQFGIKREVIGRVYIEVE